MRCLPLYPVLKETLLLRAEWLGLADSKVSGRCARGLQVSFDNTVLLTLRFDRRIRIPPRHFLVGPMANAFLSLRIGSEPHAMKGRPHSAVALADYLLAGHAEKDLREVASCALKDDIGPQVLRLLVGDALSGALHWMEQNDALAATELERRRLIGLMLRMTDEADVVWSFLCRHRAERLLSLLLPLLPDRLAGHAPETWIRTATGRCDLVERARHFPVEWINAAAGALPAPAGLVRPYLTLWLDHLKRARMQLVMLDAPARLCWVKTMATLCARIVALKASTTPMLIGGETAFSSLRLDAKSDVALSLGNASMATHTAASPLRMIPRQLVHKVLLRAANELHKAFGEQETAAVVHDLHRILDWMGAASGINHDMLGAAGFKRLADEARLWRILLEEVQQWRCVLTTSGEHTKGSQAGSWQAARGEGKLTIQSLCSDRDLAWAGMTLKNCLQNTDARVKYRRGCLRGVRRIFLLANGAGHGLGALTIAWHEGRWRVDEAKGACNRELDTSFQSVIDQFVGDYNRLQPGPYAVVDV